MAIQIGSGPYSLINEGSKKIFNLNVRSLWNVFGSIFGFLLFFYILAVVFQIQDIKKTHPSILLPLFIFIYVLIFFWLYPLKMQIIRDGSSLIVKKTESFFIKKEHLISLKRHPYILGIKEKFSWDSGQINLGAECYRPVIIAEDNKIQLYPLALRGMSRHKMMSELELKEIAQFLGIGYKLE